MGLLDKSRSLEMNYVMEDDSFDDDDDDVDDDDDDDDNYLS